MQLLTLEARVVVGTVDGYRPVIPNLSFHPVNRAAQPLHHHAKDWCPQHPGRSSRARSSCSSKARIRLSAFGGPAEADVTDAIAKSSNYGAARVSRSP
jgi:hypothetical protein